MRDTSNKYLYGILLGVILAVLFYFYIRPLPSATVTNQVPLPPKTQAIQLPWPASGQAALGAAGYGVLAHNNITQAAPIGSTAKIFTALAVLRQKPIAAGSQGATITLDSSDVDLFNYYYTRDGSVTNVAAGEQITELQALQALLLPSSNNMADSLAKWAFGSVNSYLPYANKMVQALGLTHTQIGDTNGFSDTTTSTADDLVKLGLIAIKNPVLASVVNQTAAQIPVAGNINNLNFLLGKDGVIGIKTGSTIKAGGCYVFAAQHDIQGHKITFVGAILNQPTLTDAINEASPILSTADTGFQQITVVRKNQALGSFKTAWGSTAQFKSDRDLSLFVWKGADIKISSQPDSVQTAKKGDFVGRVIVASSLQSVSAPLVLGQNLSCPSPLWRLYR